MANSNIYEMAISNARAELHALRVEVEQLSRRQAQLEAFITNTEPLISNTRQLRLPQAQEEEQAATESKDFTPIWKSIKLAINGKGARFTVKDAIEALSRIGKPIESPNRTQIVRNAILKRPDTFVQIGPGLFSLIGLADQEESKEPAEAGSQGYY